MQQFFAFNRRFIYSFAFYEWRLRQKRINRIGFSRLRCDIVLLVASHKIDCTVARVTCREESSTLSTVATCLS